MIVKGGTSRHARRRGRGRHRGRRWHDRRRSSRELSGAERDRRDRPARLPGRTRSARALQRAGPDATGKAWPAAARRCAARRLHGVLRHAAELDAADRRRGARSTPSWRRGRDPRVDFGLWGCARARQPRAHGGARRARRDRLQGVHVAPRHRGLRPRRRHHALRGHGRGRAARPAGGRPRRERRADVALARPDGARLHGLAAGGRRARGDRPRDRVRRGDRLRAAHRARVLRPRRRAGHRRATAAAST